MAFIKIIAETVNGTIKPFPIEVFVTCGQLKPIGIEVVRNYDGNECILAKRVYLVYHNGDVLGTTQFKTLDEFLSYQKEVCVPDSNYCDFYIDGCQVVFGDCLISQIK